MNEKYKPSYSARVNSFLFMGTNQPVRISDAKSGNHPTSDRRTSHWSQNPDRSLPCLDAQIDFELGAIAHHCLEVYREMGKNYYNAYRPLEMMLQTDVFFNFIEANYDIFKEQDGTTLKQAYALYKEFCLETGIERQLPQYKVREELRNYFDSFKDRTVIDGDRGAELLLRLHRTSIQGSGQVQRSYVLAGYGRDHILFNLQYADCAAQYAKENGTPKSYWVNVKTRLADLDPTKLHYVKVPENHIVIDFDLKDEDGEKSLERNLEAASRWPATYAEFSKSGRGVHLHYIYGGDVSVLDRVYSEGIEIKVFTGDVLCDVFSKCNSVPIATINSGLPTKEKKVLQTKTIKSEKGLRDLIAKNLRKEIHPGTKPSVDFIKHILDEAYSTGMKLRRHRHAIRHCRVRKQQHQPAT
jgi:hypothetical protein